MKKIIIFLSLITLPTFFYFFNPRFFYTQDYIFIARLQQMSASLFSGQFPVRWAPDLRFGEPVFNFYAPLPYYIGALINLVGVNILITSKILFILSSILSAFTMYIFCRKLFNQKGAILGTLLYTYAPYRAVDMYVRGSLSETWAFIFFPLIFYNCLLVSEKASLKRIFFLALSLTGLFLTHNVTTLMFLPFIALWCLYLVLKEKNWKIIMPFLISFVWALAFSAFFLIPALLERQFIQTKYLTVGYFNFRAHFVALSQFFSTFWGYGSSLWGPIDGLSFQVGVIHWVSVALSLVVGFIFRKDRKFLLLLSFLGIAFLISLFLQHTKSAFIWEAIPIMAFIQFPWRFLAISIFISSIVGAVVGDRMYDRFKALYIVLIISVIAINFQYFRPKEYVENNFFDKFLNVEKMHQGVDLTKDYLPIWVEDPDGQYFTTPRAQEGNIKVVELKRNSTSLNASINSEEKSIIELPLAYFPGWEVWADGNLLSQLNPSKQGLIRFELPKGEYKIRAEFKDSLIRALSNMISLLFILFTIILASRRFKLR